jgi:hypothetical protein
MMTTMTKDWAQPKPVDDVTLAFPASVVGSLLPPISDIPKEFSERSNPWGKLTSEWFFRGLKGQFIPKDGIDKQAAMRHLGAVMRSFEPKHEHKEAGVAYLMSLWFDRYEPSR